MTTEQKQEIIALADKINKGKAGVAVEVSKSYIRLTVYHTYAGNSIEKGDKDNKRIGCAMFYDYTTIIRVLGKMKEQMERI
jgi:S-adenosylmethionine synthetase